MVLIGSICLLLSCTKDKVCDTAVQFSGQRGVFVGKWLWVSTPITDSSGPGQPSFYIYTPANQSVNYSCEISVDGLFIGYKDGVEETRYRLTEVAYEFYSSPADVVECKINCTPATNTFQHSVSNTTNDTILMSSFPYKINDDVNHIYSGYSIFIRE